MDKALQREQKRTRLRVKRYRKKHSVTSSTPDSVTEKSALHGSVTKYPAVIVALSDIKKRAKLRAICESLSEHKCLKDVSYGVYGCSMDVVAEMLTTLE